MSDWLFIGPTLLSGIGQANKKYANILDAEYIVFGERPKRRRYSKGFAFILPTTPAYEYPCDTMFYMTVCETEPVNEVYRQLTRHKEIFCPSEFSMKILEKQFPEVTWKLLRHWAPERPHKCPSDNIPYTFYTIGNVIDSRKNINSLLKAFHLCKFGSEARLLIKATCNQDFTIDVPGVIVLKNFMSDEQLDRIHDSCHCYINCSHSEGVGMGAVEAALRSKPVIITEYGGLKEYVKTPWVITSPKGPIGFDDFLFKREHEWGHPSNTDIIRCLKECFEKKVSFWDHTHTRVLMDQVQTQLKAL